MELWKRQTPVQEKCYQDVPANLQRSHFVVSTQRSVYDCWVCTRATADWISRPRVTSSRRMKRETRKSFALEESELLVKNMPDKMLYAGFSSSVGHIQEKWFVNRKSFWLNSGGKLANLRVYQLASSFSSMWCTFIRFFYSTGDASYIQLLLSCSVFMTIQVSQLCLFEIVFYMIGDRYHRQTFYFYTCITLTRLSVKLPPKKDVIFQCSGCFGMRPKLENGLE